jgi:hypothetical protein
MFDQAVRQLGDKPNQRQADQRRLRSAVCHWQHGVLLQYAPLPVPSWRWRFVYSVLAGHSLLQLTEVAVACVLNSNISSVVRAFSAPRQSPLHTFEQPRFTERLAQKIDCPGPHDPLSKPILGECSNEDHRRPVAMSNQVLLQLNAAHAGHLHVRNETRGLAQARRQQELLCRSKRMCRESK